MNLSRAGFARVVFGALPMIGAACLSAGEPGTYDIDDQVEGAEAALAQCPSVGSAVEDRNSQPQIMGTAVAPGASSRSWLRPTRWTSIGAAVGVEGRPAGHEGDDYIHTDQSVSMVEVVAASAGKVVHVRTGCPQSALFTSNTAARECGAGWGNHVIVHHGGGLYTRYAHLDLSRVLAGETVIAGQVVGTMGNSGRSDRRHLHFELGTLPTSRYINSCLIAGQNFDRVHQPGTLY